MAGRTVVVLGGGIGGISAATRLRRRLGREHQVIVVDQSTRFEFAASLLWVMAGARSLEQISRPLSGLRRRGIEVRTGRVEAIAAHRRSVVIDGQPLNADHLVIALGAEFATNAVPGMAGYSVTYTTNAGAQELSRRLPTVEAGRILVTTAAPLYKCPAAPYEAALLIDAGLRRRGVRQRVEVVMHAAEPTPMPVAGPDVSAAVRAMLAERDIDYTPSHQVTSVEPGRAHYADGASVSADLIVNMPGITPPAVIADSGLAGASGWIDADRHTLATNAERVWAVGDNTSIPLAIGKPLPRAGVFAHAQALAVADRIASDITRKSCQAVFDGHGGCFIETGMGRAGYGSGNFYAEPAPNVALRRPGRRHHWEKVIFEQNVLRRWL